jgi:F-type H+-transporting ATPase subunit a
MNLLTASLLLSEAPTLSIEGATSLYSFRLFGEGEEAFYLHLTSSIAVQWIVMVILGVLFFALGRNLKVKPETKRQAAAEWIVGMFDGMVRGSMGAKYKNYGPYIGTLFMFSMALSYTVFLGFSPPTADISVIGAWGILTFTFVQINRFKTGGLVRGVTSYMKPTPLTIISEFSNPISQCFRHYGNILAGVVIGGLIFWALQVFIRIPLLVPAIAGLYFDLFMGGLQAFVFASLTMVYIAMAEIDPPAPKAAKAK